MTLRTRILLWLLPALTVLAVGQMWLLRSVVTRETDATNTVAQNSNNPAGQIGVPIPRPTQEFNNSTPPPAPNTADAISTPSNAEKAQDQTSLAKPNSSDAIPNAGSSSKVPTVTAPIKPTKPVATKPTSRAEQNTPVVKPRPAQIPAVPIEQSRPVAQPSPSATPAASPPAVLENTTSSSDTLGYIAKTQDKESAQLSELKRMTASNSVLVRQRNGNLEFEAISNPNNWILLTSVGVLILALLLGALGVRRSLSPLYSLAGEIERRNASSLEMIAVPPLPELRPAVNALNRLLTDMNDTLERLKTQEASARRFAYNASHELRNPLTAARNYLEVLERHPSRTEATQGALNALDRTERILSSLLQLARLEGQGTPKRERIDLSSFLEAHFDVPVKGSGEVWAERDLLELSLENLVNNAANHAGGASAIRVETGKESTWLWVEDAGPGFQSELLAKAFEPFAKQGAGTGLGLAIVEAVARVHGGTVRAENRLEGGARVGFSLPAFFI
jgi:signal transduction histidine kinase